MNTTTTGPSTPPQTPLPPERPRLWRVGRWCLIGLVTLATLFALYHIEENWRGRRAWTQYKATMEAQGAVFEWEKLIPPPVPDDQNFAMTPLLKPILDMNAPGTLDAEGNDAHWRDPKGKERVEAIKVDFSDPAGSGQDRKLPKGGQWRLGERLSLGDWQAYYATSTNVLAGSEPRDPAEAVLKALSRYDDELNELKNASNRPYSRYNIYYGEANPFGILLPHLSVLRNIAKVAHLKAIAELNAGNSEAAFEDVQLILRLSDSTTSDPFLISHLVRLAILEIALRTIWEGMIDHHWSPTQLESFESTLRQIDLISEMRPTFEAERTFGSEIVELMVSDPATMVNLEHSTGDGQLAQSILPRLIPKGWIYLEGVNYNRVFDDYYLAVLPSSAAELDVAEVRSAHDEFESFLGGTTMVNAVLNHRLLVKMLLPALGRVVERGAEAQAMKDMAVIALALECHHLENRSYPETLAALSAGHATQLPSDPVSHKPFHYERVEPDSYRLWSVGWNRQDDGGEVFYEMRSGKRRFTGRDQQLDWVWPSAKGMHMEEVEY